VTAVRAVVFDLWETLIDFPREESMELQRRTAALLGVEEPDFTARWLEADYGRSTGPIRAAMLEFGMPEHLVEEIAAMRLDSNRRWLVPRPGAVETLKELRRRGQLLGMISVCTEEVALLWDESPFTGLFDSAVFSCSVGLKKPDPAIYLLACEQLGVEPHEALFVGDGANDELAGARRVGMQAVLIHRPGEEPFWQEVRDWDGPRITSIPGVLDLV
jgi:putative hydrolase of the HAD superfamily